jgi:SYP7 family syntaxin
MADNLYRVQAASPELAALLRRLKTIYALTGGEVAAAGGKKDDFFAKKSVLIAQMDQFDKLVEARDQSGLGKDSRDYIRLKVQINGELRKLEDAVKDLAEQNRREVEKRGSKLSADDVAARRDVLEAVIGEFQTKFKMAKGFSSAGAAENLGGGAGMRVLTREQVMKGQFAGAGIKTKQEAMTGEQQQKMAQLQAVSQEQDGVLDEISKGVDELKDLAEKMQDELVLQDKMLSDLDGKTDKTQTKLDAVNDRMKDALAKINDKSSNFCVSGGRVGDLTAHGRARTGELARASTRGQARVSARARDTLRAYPPSSLCLPPPFRRARRSTSSASCCSLASRRSFTRWSAPRSSAAERARSFPPFFLRARASESPFVHSRY